MMGWGPDEGSPQHGLLGWFARRRAARAKTRYAKWQAEQKRIRSDVFAWAAEELSPQQLDELARIYEGTRGDPPDRRPVPVGHSRRSLEGPE